MNIYTDINAKNIKIEIPNKNGGKFRFIKTDENNSRDSFPTLKEKFNQNIFLEWQIGYDAKQQDVDSNKKITSLDKNSFIFVGANGEKKYPYEISEILFRLAELRIIPIKDIISLKDDISSFAEFFPQNISQSTEKKEATINELHFQQYETILPSYVLQNDDKTRTETVVKKQQYAYGVQPMVYFCIPLLSFLNGEEMISFSSKEKPLSLVYIFDKNNIHVVYNLFKILSSASESHKKDVMAILEVLIKNLS